MGQKGGVAGLSFLCDAEHTHGPMQYFTRWRVIIWQCQLGVAMVHQVGPTSSGRCECSALQFHAGEEALFEDGLEEAEVAAELAPVIGQLAYVAGAAGRVEEAVAGYQELLGLGVDDVATMSIATNNLYAALLDRSGWRYVPVHWGLVFSILVVGSTCMCAKLHGVIAHTVLHGPSTHKPSSRMLSQPPTAALPAALPAAVPARLRSPPASAISGWMPLWSGLGGSFVCWGSWPLGWGRMRGRCCLPATAVRRC
jgi:hypothetical protein